MHMCMCVFIVGYGYIFIYCRMEPPKISLCTAYKDLKTVWPIKVTISMSPGLMTSWNYIPRSTSSGCGAGSCPHHLCLAHWEQPGEPEGSGLHLHPIIHLLNIVWQTFLTRAHPGPDQSSRQEQNSYNPKRTWRSSEPQERGVVSNHSWGCWAEKGAVNSEHLPTVVTSKEKYKEAFCSIWWPVVLNVSITRGDRM